MEDGRMVTARVSKARTGESLTEFDSLVFRVSATNRALGKEGDPRGPSTA